MTLKTVRFFSLAATLALALAMVGTGCGDNATGNICGDNEIGDLEQCDGTDLGTASCTTLGFQGGTLGCSTVCIYDTSSCTGGGPVCGDGVMEGTEACDGADLGGETCISQGFDSGNLACTANCTLDVSNCSGGGPVCGDGITNGTESCDGADLAGETCISQGFTGGNLACTGICTFDTSACTGVGPVCGDGTVNGTEACDGADLAGETCISQGFNSGNLGCTANCTFDTSACQGGGPVCGDGQVNQGTEQCDGADLAGLGCTDLGYGGGNLACSANCNYDVSGCTGTGPVCGDGVSEGLESCDGTDLNGTACTDLGFDSGTLACTAGCTFDTSGCRVNPVCGDGTAEGTEACDGTDLAGQSCLTQGFAGGTLACTANCTFDTTGCTGGPICGDNNAEGLEQCDGSDLAGMDCVALGFSSGTLGCSVNCTFDVSQCVSAAVCGDGTVEGTEQCDGTNLAGMDCVALGFTGGSLACDANCGFDVSGCTNPPACGDGTANGSEECDGSDLAGMDCMSLGFSGGSLACTFNCTFDVAGCTSLPVCGDGTAEGSEQCDGLDLAGVTCMDLGFSGGNLGCSAGCTFDTSACFSGPVCGDGVATAPEDCDGTDLGGVTCLDLGYTGGTLGCSANCTFDASTCTGSGSGLLCEVCDPAAPNCQNGGLCLTFDGTNFFCGQDCAGTGTCPTGYTCYDLGNGTDFQCAPTGGDICDQCTPTSCPTATCGDGVAELGEQCDGSDLQGLTCVDLGYTGGTLSCAGDCSFDASGCTGGGSGLLCEICVTDTDCVDPGAMCISFAGGQPFCGNDCSGTGSCPTGYACYDLGGGLAQCAPEGGDICDQCTPTSCPTGSCGNGVAEAGEQCDGGDLGGATCLDLGFTGGTLACDIDCLFDTTGCTGSGNGQLCEMCAGDTDCVDPGAMCLTFGGQPFCGNDCSGTGTCPTGYSCYDLGGGLAQCAPTAGDICDQCTPSFCPSGTCGDGVAEAGEQCDGADLGGATCIDLGYTGGNLACAADCSFDASGCTGGGSGQLCEVCAGDTDCIDPGAMCISFGAGQPFCGNDCSGTGTCPTGYTCYDLGGGLAQCAPTAGDICPQCTPTFCPSGGNCGDGIADPGESCDGGDLGGATCIDLGFTGGSLACAGDCTYDTSGCTGGGSWTCDPSYFGTGDGCDCGCGVLDPDCPDASIASCVYCDDPGSCNSAPCPGTIDPVQNWLCGGGPVCGNGVCEAGEDSVSCPADCSGGGSLLCEDCAGDGDCAEPGAVCVTMGTQPFCGSDCSGTGSCPTGYTCYDLGGGQAQCGPTAGDICSQCTPTSCPSGTCGDGVAEMGEECDGSDLGGLTCADLGFTGGSLGCAADCTFDVSGCTGGGSGQLCEMCAGDPDCVDPGAMCIAFGAGQPFCGNDCSGTGTCPTGYTCYDLGGGLAQCAPTAGDICPQCTPTFCP